MGILLRGGRPGSLLLSFRVERTLGKHMRHPMRFNNHSDTEDDLIRINWDCHRIKGPSFASQNDIPPSYSPKPIFNMSLQGKVAIVTGAGRVSPPSAAIKAGRLISPQGIGASVAVALAKEGASVVINYAHDSSKSRAEDVATSIRALSGVQIGNGKTIVVQADVSSLEDIDRLVKETVNEFGKIDILVGIFIPIGGSNSRGVGE